MATPKAKKDTTTATQKAEFLTFKGKSMYARVFEPALPPPQDPTQPPRWTVDVLIDKATKTELMAKGLRIKDGNPKYEAFVEENGLLEKGFDGSFVTVKKSTVRKAYNQAMQEPIKDEKGNQVFEPASRPKVMDTAWNEIPESANLKIGNGSDIEVCYTITKPLLARSGNYGARLVSTKILNLVEWAPAPQGSFVYGESGAQHSSSTPVIEEYEASVELLDEDDMPF